MERRTSSSATWKRPSAPRTCSPAGFGGVILRAQPEESAVASRSRSFAEFTLERSEGLRLTSRCRLPYPLQLVVGLARPGQGVSVRELSALVVLLHRFHERPAVDLHHGLAALGELSGEARLDVDDLAGRSRGGFLVDRLEDLPVGL